MKILMGSILNMDIDMNGVVITAKEQQSKLMGRNHHVQLLTPYIYPHQTILFTLLRWTSVAFTRTGLTIFTLLNLTVKALILARLTLRSQQNYDVFHAHDVVSAMVFEMLARGSNVTLLNAHFYVEPWEEFVAGGYVKRNDLTYHILKYLFLRTLKSSNLRFMPVSQRNSNLLAEMVSNQKLPSIVLYPGIDSTSNHNPTQIDTPYLINVGSMDVRKNQIELIGILAELERLGFCLPLVLVGPENALEKERINRRISALNIKTPIHFLGQKSPEETLLLIQSAQLYLHVSSIESFGRTLVEAMSTKTPVVAREYDAVHEILDEAAIIKSEWNTARAAAFIKTLLENKVLRENLQKSQHAKYLRSFTGTQMVNTYTNALEGSWRLS